MCKFLSCFHNHPPPFVDTLDEYAAILEGWDKINVVIALLKRVRIDGALYLLWNIMVVHGQTMVTLNIIWCGYKWLLLLTKLLCMDYFTHSFWEPNNLSNLYTWYLSWPNPNFEVIEIALFINEEDIAYIYCQCALGYFILF